jgi:hypothetical protein
MIKPKMLFTKFKTPQCPFKTASILLPQVMGGRGGGGFLWVYLNDKRLVGEEDATSAVVNQLLLLSSSQAKSNTWLKHVTQTRDDICSVESMAVF